MRQATAILLIGVTLTVGLPLVSGLGVVDVSAAETLVVDQDGTAEYRSIQTAIDDASAGDTVEIRPGTYAETIVVEKNITVTAPDGATLDGTDVENPDAGVTIGNDKFDQAENIEPTIRGLTITRYKNGIQSTTDGNWVVSDVTIRIVQQQGIDAFRSNGDWTVRDSKVIATGFNGIDAGENGEWLIEDTVVRRTEFDGINARSTFDDWTIRNVSIQDSGDPDTSIDATDSDGNWVIEQTSVQDRIAAEDSNGKWEIRRSVITGDVPISAENTLGEWRVSQSVINQTDDTTATAIDATDAIGEGTATDNWWGSPSGPDENACVGNVDCSDPLTTRPSDVGYNPDDGDESTPTPTPTPTPSPVPDDNETAQTTTVTVTLDSVPAGLQRFNVSVAGPSGSSITTVSAGVISGRSFEIFSGGEGDSTVTARGVDIAGSVGQSSDPVRLYEAEFEFADTLKRSDLTVTVTDLTTDNDTAMSESLLTVTTSAAPETDITNPVIVSPNPATDPDGDGQLEDVNGDGEATFDDAIALAFNTGAASVTENRDSFDFDGDGDVDFDDAIALAFAV